MRAGDRLMFCSDGVCGLVDDPEIESALAIPEIEEAVGQLVAVALAEGGIDNITVIVADVVEAGGMNDLIVLGAAAEREIPDTATKIRDGAGRHRGHDHQPAPRSCSRSIPKGSTRSATPRRPRPGADWSVR